MLFSDLKSEILDLNSQLQEVQSSAYVVLPVEEDYRLISYFDMDVKAMGFTVVNSDMMEIKLLSDLPVAVLVSFGKFVEAIERWQSGDIEDFPFVDYVGPSFEMKSQFDYVPPDNSMDGDEGKLS